MSISNLSTGLADFNPVYNPLVYIFDSSNKNSTGFRYVVDVYLAGTSNKIFEARVAPRPNDGYGYIDLSKPLSNYTTYDINLSNTTSMAITNSYVNYDVKIGEEYITEWSFIDSTFYSGNITKLTGVLAHSFNVGDQIVIELATASYFPSLEGLKTVSSISGTNSIIVNVPFVSSPTNNGVVRYADNRKTIFRNLYTYSSQTAWNGSIRFDEWVGYTASSYKINATSSNNKLLTSLDGDYMCAETQDLWINWAPYLSSMPMYVYFINDGGDVFRKSVNNMSEKLRQFSAGPNNVGSLSLVSGTGSLVKASTNYYDFYIASSSGTQMSKKYRVNIDRRCKIEDYEILFKDRLGSFLSINFPLRSKISGNIERSGFNKQIGNYNINKWSYSVSDAGFVNTDMSITTTYELWTNFINNDMDNLFVELLSSSLTYIKIDGVYYSCIVKDKDYDIQSINYRKLIKRSIKVELSNENIINI